MADLKRLSIECDFGNLRDDLLKDMLVTGVHNNQLRERLLRTANLTLAEAIKLGVAFEETKLHTDALKKSMKVDKIRNQGKNFSNQGGKFRNRSQNQNNFYQQQSNHIKNCKFCGGSHNRGKCPAYGVTCRKCKKVNHFEQCCRSKVVQSIQEEDENEKYDSDSEEEFVIKSIRKEILV